MRRMGNDCEHRIIAFFIFLVIFVISIYAITRLFFTPYFIEWKPLTKEQIISKSKECQNEGKTISFLYDEDWQVYAVKCKK